MKLRVLLTCAIILVTSAAFAGNHQPFKWGMSKDEVMSIAQKMPYVSDLTPSGNNATYIDGVIYRNISGDIYFWGYDGFVNFTFPDYYGLEKIALSFKKNSSHEVKKQLNLLYGEHSREWKRPEKHGGDTIFLIWDEVDTVTCLNVFSPFTTVDIVEKNAFQKWFEIMLIQWETKE